MKPKLSTKNTEISIESKIIGDMKKYEKNEDSKYHPKESREEQRRMKESKKKTKNTRTISVANDSDVPTCMRIAYKCVR